VGQCWGCCGDWFGVFGGCGGGCVDWVGSNVSRWAGFEGCGCGSTVSWVVGRKFVSLVGLSVEFGRLLAVTRRDRERELTS